MSLRHDNLENQQRAYKTLGKLFLHEGDYRRALQCGQALTNKFDSTTSIADSLLGQGDSGEALSILGQFQSQNQQEMDALKSKAMMIEQTVQKHH